MQQSDFAFLPFLHWFWSFFPFFSGMLCMFQFRFASDAYTSIFRPLNDKVLFLQGSPWLAEHPSHMEWAGRVQDASPPHLCLCLPCTEASTFSTRVSFAEERCPTCQLARWQTEPQTHTYLCLFSPFASNRESYLVQSSAPWLDL